MGRGYRRDRLLPRKHSPPSQTAIAFLDVLTWFFGTVGSTFLFVGYARGDAAYAVPRYTPIAPAAPCPGSFVVPFSAELRPLSTRS